MTDDLLTKFRSEMPMPDEETTQRIYQRATNGRRSLVTRRNLVAVVAVLALAGIAGGLSAALGGGGSTHPAGTVTGPHPGGGGPGPGGGISLNPLSTDFTASGNAYSSIDLTITSPAAETTLNVRVVRSDASDVSNVDSAPNTVVFSEQVSMTAVDSDMQDATHSTWSGTLTPSDWTGGCEQALYRIEYGFGSDDSTGSSGWFQCSGPDVDATNPFLY